MNANELINVFSKSGSAIEVVDGQLKVTAPKTILTDEIKNALQLLKVEIIKLITVDATNDLILQEPKHHYRAEHLKPFEQERYADTRWIMTTVLQAEPDRRQALLDEYSDTYQQALQEVPEIKATGHARRTANTNLREKIKEMNRQ